MTLPGFTLDQAGYANRAFSKNLTRIALGGKVGIKSFYAVHDIFFNNTERKSLKPGWQAAWAAAQTAIEPLIDTRKLGDPFGSEPGGLAQNAPR